MTKSKTEQFESTVKSIVWTLRRISQIIYLDSRKIAKQYGLTAAQASVIKTLNGSSGTHSSSSLSRELGVTPPNITGIIDRLEEKGLVEKQKKEGDRRTWKLELTEKGRDLAKSLPNITELKLLHGLKDLSHTEVYGIYSGLSTISEVIGSEFFEKEATDQAE
jgi:DNA-binding MarR family transcriptional regulator